MIIVDILLASLFLGWIFKKPKEENIVETVKEIIKPQITESKKYIFRPSKLSEYIGQDKAKSQIALNIQKCMRLRPIHFLISAPKGRGKTTLALITARMLNANIIEKTGADFDEIEQVEEVINRINEYPFYSALFIDEIHTMQPRICEQFFYILMEDFKFRGVPVKPFSLIGATTEKHILAEKVAPMLDRFGAIIDLENYFPIDIENIIKQYKSRQYLNFKDIPQEVYENIAINCKLTPRIAITLMEDYLIALNIQKIFNNHRIIKDGLTDIDFKILNAVKEKPVGAKTLSRIIGLTEKDYINLYEPYLIEQQYLMPTARGRLISTKGLELLTV